MRTAMRFAVFCLTLFLPGAVRASCGAASCPIDTQTFHLADPGRWSIDLTFQYIDQDQPRIGTADAEVGELPSKHDEVRTINRITSLALRYAPSERVQLGVVLPWISRFHEHLAGEHEHEELTGKHGGPHEAGPERWSLEGAGDLALEAQARVWSRDRSSLWLTGALELPTGPDDLDNDDGEIAELPIQPGSGSTDLTVGLAWRGALLRETGLQGALGNTTALPYFLSVTYRRNGEGRENYRLGDEWQANVGGAYPFTRRLEALLQLNARFRGKDSPGETEEDPGFTGGTFVYVSPGAQLSLGEQWAGYLFVQVPVYQDVNRLQLTSSANWLGGLQARF
jgi:hypothetical protein